MALPALLTNFLPSSIRPNQPSLSLFSRPRSSFSSPSAVSSGARFAKCALTIEDEDTARRSANWKPSVWDYGFVQSLNTDFPVLILFSFLFSSTQPNLAECMMRMCTCELDLLSIYRRELNRAYSNVLEIA